jgi:hypothetical protein
MPGLERGAALKMREGIDEGSRCIGAEMSAARRWHARDWA